MKIRCFVALVLCLAAVSARATPITSTVVVGDKEWAQVNLFTNLAWDNLNAVCPSGVCGTSTLNGWDMNGWTWASVADIADLFRAFLPFPTATDFFFYVDADPSLSLNFMNAFSPTLNALPAFVRVQGYASELRSTDGFAYSPVVQYVESLNKPSIANTDTGQPRTTASSITGAWFFRSATADPEPATSTLVAVAFAGIGWQARRRRRDSFSRTMTPRANP